MIRRILAIALLAGATSAWTGLNVGCDDERKTVTIREYEEHDPVEPVSPGEPIVE